MKYPAGADFVFSHPPYWDIIQYQYQRGNSNVNDLSNIMTYDEFINKLNKVNAKIYYSLLNGGRHAILVGDVRKKGKYYSIIKDMAYFGELESHIIKIQHNCVSDKKRYSNNSFIPIKHEHLLIFRKNAIWAMNIKVTKNFKKNIKQMCNVTWRDLVQAALEEFNNKAKIDDILNILKDSEKAKKNNHVREKIRQVLNTCKNFQKHEDMWILAI